MLVLVLALMLACVAAFGPAISPKRSNFALFEDFTKDGPQALIGEIHLTM